MNIFRRPSISSLYDSLIYENARSLINAKAHLDNAKLQVAKCEATVAYHEQRMKTLEADAKKEASKNS